MLYVSDKVIGKRERGQSEPGIDIIVALARLYGISVDDLLGNPPPESGLAEATVPAKKLKSLLTTANKIMEALFLTALAAAVTLIAIRYEKLPDTIVIRATLAGIAAASGPKIYIWLPTVICVFACAALSTVYFFSVRPRIGYGKSAVYLDQILSPRQLYSLGAHIAKILIVFKLLYLAYAFWNSSAIAAQSFVSITYSPILLVAAAAMPVLCALGVFVYLRRRMNSAARKNS